MAGMEEVLGKCLWKNRRKEDMAKISCAVLARNWSCLAMIGGGRAIVLRGAFPLQVILPALSTVAFEAQPTLSYCSAALGREG